LSGDANAGIDHGIILNRQQTYSKYDNMFVSHDAGLEDEFKLMGNMSFNGFGFWRILIGFYLSLGAEPMKDWTVYRVSGSRLNELAGIE
jgi:hypothetical protein